MGDNGHLRSISEYASMNDVRKALLTDPDCEKPTMKKNQEQTLSEHWDWVLTNYDVGTTEPQSIEEELLRLQTLQSYLRLDESADTELDRLTAMASRVFKTPIVLISLIDIGKQWFLSNHGLRDAKHGPRKIAFCAHAIQGKQKVLVVPDATKDYRFANLPQVVGPPHVTFYAGTPLMSPEGYKIGSFCLVDTKPRTTFTHDDCESLIDFAAMAMDCLVVNRRKKQQINRQVLASSAHDVFTPLMGLQLSLSLLQEDENLSLPPKQRL